MFTVLYIEDNRLNMRLVRKSLKPMNYNMLEAWNGQQGLDIALAQVPDVILLDLHLPDTTGIEVAAQLRANVKTGHIPIIALTADVTESIKRQCLNGDFDAYLTKPISRARLLRTIKQIMETKAPAATF